MKYFIFLLSLFLVACGSSPDQRPKVNDVAQNIYRLFDVTKDSSDIYTFSWLNRSNYKPQRLAQYTLKGGEQISEEVYQWSKGDQAFQKIRIHADYSAIPKYIREPNLSKDAQLDLDVRFGEHAEILFQKIFLDGRYYQLTQDKLLYIEEQAQKRVNELKARNPKNSQVYQGVWQYGSFKDCDGGKIYDIEFSDYTSIPDNAFLVIRARKNNPFIIGNVSLQDAEIIWQAPLEQKCLQKPE